MTIKEIRIVTQKNMGHYCGKNSSEVSCQEQCLEQPVGSWSQTRTVLATRLAQCSQPYLRVLGNGGVLWEGGSWSSARSVSSTDRYYCLNFTPASCSNSSQPFLPAICLPPMQKQDKKGRKAAGWEHVSVVLSKYCLQKPSAVRVFVVCGTFFTMLYQHFSTHNYKLAQMLFQSAVAGYLDWVWAFRFKILKIFFHSELCARHFRIIQDSHSEFFFSRFASTQSYRTSRITGDCLKSYFPLW